MEAGVVTDKLKLRILIAVGGLLIAALNGEAIAGETGRSGFFPAAGIRSDSVVTAGPIELQLPRNVWGLDILFSNDGFGLGGFYMHEISPDIMGFAGLSVSESKDPREVEQIDIFGNSYTPGKLNRFLVLPLIFGVEYRLFREDIVDTFRPYVNIGAGPAMIYAMPYVDVIQYPDGTVQTNQVEFFSAIGRGRPHYTVSSFIGFGAHFGSDRSSIFGVNFRYYFTYLLSGALPSLYDVNNPAGSPIALKNDFGGFFITLNVGMGY